MKLWKDRRPGAFFGMSLTMLLPVSFGAWAVTVNPWFMDEPLLFLGLVLLPCALIGGYLGAVIARAWYSRSLLTANLLGIAWIFLRPVPQGIEGVDLFVFGMDGATWDLIDKLDMPNLERLQAQGSRSILESEEPMLSPLLWTTMATGQHHDDHGIRNFNTSVDRVRVARVWDIADMEGLSVGLYKWLVTHPAEAGESGGFVVPAWLAEDPHCDPPELSIIKQIELSNRLKRKNKAEQLANWQIPFLAIPRGLRFSTLRHATFLWLAEKVRRPGPKEKERDMQLLRVWMDRDFFLAQMHREAGKSTFDSVNDVGEKLTGQYGENPLPGAVAEWMNSGLNVLRYGQSNLKGKPTNIATFTIYSTDALSHNHWGWMTQCHDMDTLTFTGADENCPEWATAIPESYQQGDEVLGQILDEIGWDTNIVVLSDHGFRPADEGDAGKNFIPRTEWLKKQLNLYVGAVEVHREGKKISVSLEEPDIDGNVTLQMEKLNFFLSNLTLRGRCFEVSSDGMCLDAEPDAPLFSAVLREESQRTVGLTFRVEQMTSGDLEQRDVDYQPCYEMEGPGEGCSAKLGEYAKLDDPLAGVHHPDGILLASGPVIQHEVREEAAHLVDIAPTLLTLLGLSPSEDMPGQSLWGKENERMPANYYDKLAPGADFNDLIGSPTDDSSSGIREEQLRALGYMED